MFEKVMVANRGEIAVRIMRTLKKMGIQSVAIYSEADENALHVTVADLALSLGGFQASESYLNISLIIQLALSHNIKAIHPGYGFLSENVGFAEECEKAGIVFIGPTSGHIHNFGLKHVARRLADECKVPCTAGTSLLRTEEEAFSAAASIGYPIILKNTAGGGGLGLQVCRSPDELSEAFRAVSRVGDILFHGAGIFLEQYIETGRHIEVQIFGDGRGGVAILGDRDCSIQRRHQKLIEECPAPDLPTQARLDMHECARKLGERVKYRSAGTVEFIYDCERHTFYFLEVNTRIQVEHTVTEEVTGVDIVECMTRLAFDPFFDITFLNERTIHQAVAIEVRINAEDPLRDFRPCPGHLNEVCFPSFPGLRVDSGVMRGSEVSIYYDSLIAKVIVHADSRKEAISLMIRALHDTKILGLTSTLEYAISILSSEAFAQMQLSTKFLNKFQYSPSVIEVLDGGGFTTVQDYPGRIKYWSVGVPPSGPMDSLSHRLANHLVRNEDSMAALECTSRGPTLLFHQDALIAITGGEVSVQIDGELKPMFTPIFIKAGSVLKVGSVVKGMRCYLAVRGGIQSFVYLNSRSSFVLGKFGGVHGDGATLKAGDYIPILAAAGDGQKAPQPNNSLSPALLDRFNFHSRVEVGVLYGPHGAPDFFTQEYIDRLFASDFDVHYNSSRLGVRLVGPVPSWTRADGGEAGLHPSNIHDCVYSMGSLNFTGDSPVILTCDGPSLGGFVCPVVITKAELWKVGQLKPGDSVRFVNVSFETALRLNRELETFFHSGVSVLAAASLLGDSIPPTTCILACIPADGELQPLVTYRQAGDTCILLEYGPMELDLGLRARVYGLVAAIHDSNIDGIIELSAGVRSLHIHYDFNVILPSALIIKLQEIERRLPPVRSLQVPSRLIRLPMAFEDSGTLEAVDRYRSTIRSSAPWLPNNVDFIQRINGLSSREEVRAAIFQANYLVLGLGDVYLGAPCAVPLDPRHRLLTSKYNPARTFTAEGTVGIGGVYMCIYGMDSPGGYQLVGRTLPIWDRNSSAEEPWLLKPFDQVSFYQVTELELLQLRRQKERGQALSMVATTFSFSSYETFLKDNDEYIKAFQESQSNAYAKEIQLWENDEVPGATVQGPANVDNGEGDAVIANSFGRVWKVLVKVGDEVSLGQEVVLLEAMKMETKVFATATGIISSVLCAVGDIVRTGFALLRIATKTSSSHEWITMLEAPMKDPNRGEDKVGALSGLTFAVKDNIDVKGVPTTAACPQFSRVPDVHATVVQRLLSAGATLLGKTNLDQFACGLNGTRSPYGPVPNSFHADYICGGSSSGSAFVVATGQVNFSLGTDTAGSGRVPAGLNNIVGLKPSKGLISTKGVLPAAASADCVSIFALTVEDAWKVLMEARWWDEADPFSRDLKLTMVPFQKTFRFGVPDDLEFHGDESSAACFDDAVSSLKAMGGVPLKINYAPLLKVASMLYDDAFVAERYSALRDFFDAHESAVIEPVRSIIARGKTYSAADLYDAQLKLRAASNQVNSMWRNIDVLVVPTSPTHYKISDMIASPIVLNKYLGHYTNFVNLLDYAAISVPSALRSDGLPFGITLIGPCASDYQLAELGQRYHHSRNLNLGATGKSIEPPSLLLSALAQPDSLRLAVVGAHLKGMPLHNQLSSRGATFVKRCSTAPVYKLYAIANAKPPKPALIYTGEGGVQIEIEIYELSEAAVGGFLSMIPPPLGLGTLHLEDGSLVKGFIAEPRALEGAQDISSFGGWRAYIASI